MALSTKKGTFTKTTTGAPTTQEINFSGSTFQPKALWIWGVATTDTNYAEGYSFSYGFSDGTRSAVSAHAGQDAVSTTVTRGVQRDDAIISILDPTSPGTEIVRASVSSFDSDGFTLSFAVNNASAYVFHYWAVGGSDITDAYVLNTASGNIATSGTGKSYTGTGFQGNFVCALSGRAAQTFNTITATWNTCIGFGIGTGTANQRYMNTGDTSAVTSFSRSHMWNNNGIMEGRLPNSSSPEFRMAITSFDSNGITFNIDTGNATTTTPFSMLIIKGGQWSVGNFTASNTTGNQDVAVSGIGQTPAAVQLITNNNTTSNNSNSGNFRLTVGAADADLNEGYTLHGDSASTSSTTGIRLQRTDKVVRTVATTSATASSTATTGEADMGALNADTKFTINWTDAINYVFLYFAVAPTARAGTWLYFHAPTSDVAGTLPSTSKSSLTSGVNAESQATNRTMDTTIGTSQTSLALTTAASTGTQSLYFTKFVSPLLNQTSIAANTWHYAIGALENNASANFPRNGAGAIWVSCYVWKPSNGTKYADIIDSNSNANFAETTTSERAIMGTFAGSAVGSLTANDAVIVLEVWAVVIQGAATAFNDTFFYDGTVEPSALGATVSSDVAAFIRTPETLTFATGTTSVSETSIHKYAIAQNVAQASIQKYSIAKYISQTAVQKYNILKNVLQSNISKYNLLRYVLQTSKHKYDILAILLVLALSKQKYNIAQYIVQASLQKYNLRKNIVGSSVEKYNILKTILQASRHKYNISKIILQSSVQKYNLFRQILQSSSHKYNIVQLIARASVQKYNISKVILQLSKQKYNILKNVTLGSVQKYNILKIMSQATIQKYHIMRPVATTLNIHKYHIARNIVQSTVQKYNLSAFVARLNIQKYHISKLILQFSVEKYLIRQYTAALSKHKYNILQNVAQLSKHRYHINVFTAITNSIQKYHVIKQILRASIQKYNISQIIAQTSLHKYDIIQVGNVIASRIMKYHISQYTVAQTKQKYHIMRYLSQITSHKYNLLRNVLGASVHKYSILQYITRPSIQKYNLFKYVAVPSIQKYEILGLFQVLAETIQKYNIRALVIQSSKHKYDIQAIAALLVSLVSKYDISQIISQQSKQRYNILRLVLLANIHKYGIRQQLTILNRHKYDILANVEATSRHKYHVFVSVPVTAAIHKYKIMQAAVAQTIHKYDITGRVLATNIHTYSIGKKVRKFISMVGQGKLIEINNAGKLMQDYIREHWPS